MSSSDGSKKIIPLLQEFSIPLIVGVFAGLIAANIDEHFYHCLIELPYCPAEHLHHYPLLERLAHVLPHLSLFDHHITIHFLINDVFMVFFFGIAAKEITESVLPGGPLNPPSKAVNPLLGTIGGVVGPVGVYALLTIAFYAGDDAYDVVMSGWGIPTATDIALAWLVARLVFGKLHPAVNFLLLLAVADDAIGLVIIAVFYPSPDHPAQPQFLAIAAVGMLAAYILRRRRVMNWIPYIAIGGTLSWLGFLKSALHPALALVPIVPFLPGPRTDTGLFESDDEVAKVEEALTGHHSDTGAHHSPLNNYEHQTKLFVDMGLFFFAFANAGVAFANVSMVTVIVLAALLVGKTIGITFFSWLGERLGFPLPTGMEIRHLVVAGVIAGMGLTVALFVAGQAFPGDSPHQGPAKMGALASAAAAAFAFLLGRILRVKERPGDDASG